MIRISLLALILLTFAKPAYAYIDVAMGSLILQTIVAGFFAFLVVWRNWTEKIKNFFKGKGFKLDETEPEVSASTTAEE